MTQIKITKEVRERLVLLEQEGKLTPKDLVEDGKLKDSPLHSMFDWDKNKAAYKYWLWQARTIIHSVKLFATTTETLTIQAPYYVRDPSLSGKEQGYISVIQLSKDPEQARESLKLEFGRAESALTRAKALAAALDLEDEVDALIGHLTGLRARLDEPEAQQVA